MVFVTTLRPLLTIRGIRYGPLSISWVVPGMNAPIGYAPMSASNSAWSPTSVPSRVAPSSTVWICARPWVSETIDSDRVSRHRTGLPSRAAIAATAWYSA